MCSVVQSECASIHALLKYRPLMLSDDRRGRDSRRRRPPSLSVLQGRRSIRHIADSRRILQLDARTQTRSTTGVLQTLHTGHSCLLFSGFLEGRRVCSQ